MGDGERSFLTYTIPSDLGEAGDQKLPLMTEQVHIADWVFSLHSLEPGAESPTGALGQGS